MSDRPDFGYIGFDGDRIGDRIVRALIGNDEASLIHFAESVEKALKSLQRRLEGYHYRVLLVTGDGHIVYGRLDPALFREITADFHEITGATLSVGIGNDLRNCYLAMKYAKSLGGGAMACMWNDKPCPL